MIINVLSAERAERAENLQNSNRAYRAKKNYGHIASEISAAYMGYYLYYSYLYIYINTVHYYYNYLIHKHLQRMGEEIFPPALFSFLAKTLIYNHLRFVFLRPSPFSSKFGYIDIFIIEKKTSKFIWLYAKKLFMFGSWKLRTNHKRGILTPHLNEESKSLAPDNLKSILKQSCPQSIIMCYLVVPV